MKILVFDPDNERKESIREIIRSLGYEEPPLRPGEDPIDLLCFLEDTSLPDIVFCAGDEGVEICRKWKMEEAELRHSTVYIIYVGDKNDDFRRAVLAGADDFLIWPTSYSAIESRIMLSEVRRRERDESALDHLTKVLSRRSIEEVLRKELERSFRSGKSIGLIFLDVDDFKDVNDNFSHEFGDVVLRELADRIKHSIRDYDYVGRLAGDEFLVVLVDCEYEDAKKRANELREAISQPFFEERMQSITVSMGLVMSESGEKDAARLIKLADDRMYEAKKSGKNRIQTMKPRK